MAENTSNRYITVAYELYTTMGGERELMEKASEQHPFQFISGMGLTLDDFEAQMLALQAGEQFDFTLTPEQAYGQYVDEAVQTLPRSVFEINGKLDTQHVYEGAVVPLVNAEGERFHGTISQITDESVTVDLNHPLAGKSLNFVGHIIESREATTAEMEQMIKMLSGEGCGGCGGCGGGCHDGGCGGDCNSEGDCQCGGGCGGCQ